MPRNLAPRVARAWIGLVSASLVVAVSAVPAAAAPSTANPPSRIASVAPAARTKAVQWYYDQEVEWEDCTEPSLECATIKAPLKWAKPGGRKISIAIARDKAAKQPAPAGAILVNPGGPGASGIDSLTVLSSMFGAKVKARYDIVAFDPRGVGASSAVRCTAKTSQMHKHLAEWFPNTHDGRVAAKKAARSWGNQCRKLTGPLLGQVDTASAARDMDVIRAVLGQSALTYVGWSYGSKLGSVYAELFPARVGRLVLDGAINPAADAGAAAAAQLKGFESSLGAWAADCVAQGACAVGAAAPEVLTAVHDLIQRCATSPLPTGTKGRQLTAALAFTGVLLSLYDDTYWPLLTLGVSNAIHGNDGSVLLMLADAYNSFDGQKYANNMLTANQAINCLDYPSADATQAQAQAAIDAAIAEAPVLGEFWMGNGISQCAHWPYPSTTTPRAVKSATKAPILVIGTTGDPATPYTNAIELTKQLRTATLLTFQGEGHTAYGRGNTCVNAVVDRYLLTGKVPREGRVCR